MTYPDRSETTITTIHTSTTRTQSNVRRRLTRTRLVPQSRHRAWLSAWRPQRGQFRCIMLSTKD